MAASQVDETGQVGLSYPVPRDNDNNDDAAAVAPERRALEKLVGATRAAALDAIAETCTTTELAQRIGVTLATASHHTTVLRDAGLIFSRRIGNTVHHRITPRGAALLDTDASPPV